MNLERAVLVGCSSEQIAFPALEAIAKFCDCVVTCLNRSENGRDQLKAVRVPYNMWLISYETMLWEE